MSDLVHMSPATLSKGRLWAALVVILFGQFIVSIDLTAVSYTHLTLPTNSRV